MTDKKSPEMAREGGHASKAGRAPRVRTSPLSGELPASLRRPDPYWPAGFPKPETGHVEGHWHRAAALTEARKVLFGNNIVWPEEVTQRRPKALA